MTPADILALLLVAPILYACARLVDFLSDRLMAALEFMSQYE
jgi:hypothetical protein